MFEPGYHVLADVSPFWLARLTSDPKVPPPKPAAPLGAEWSRWINEGVQTLFTASEGASRGLFEKARAAADDRDQCGLTSFMHASALRQAGLVEQALAVWQEARSRHAKVPQHPYYAAICLLQLGRPEEAVRTLEQAVAADSDFGPAWAALALINALARFHERALAAATRALELGCDVGDDFAKLALFQSQHMLGKEETEQEFIRPRLAALDEARAEALLAKLPPVTSLYEPDKKTGGSPVVYVSSDSAYFHKHTVPLVLSLIEAHSKVVAHIHVVNADAEVVEAVRRLDTLSPDLAVRLTGESVRISAITHPRLYHSCVRYCRLYQVVKQSAVPTLIADADLLFRGPAERLFSEHADDDYALAVCESEPMWQYVSAGINLFRPTPHARAFLAIVCAYILENLFARKGRWFLDQVALFIAHRHTRERHQVGILDHRTACDVTHAADSLVWVLANDKEGESRFTHAAQSLRRKYQFQAHLGEAFNAVCETKHGLAVYNKFDQHIGPSLATLGVWCEHEILLLQRLLRTGAVVIDAGANYGAHTLPFCRFVGSTGRVYAFEPQRLVFQALCATVALNSLTNAHCFHAALGAERGHIDVPLLDFATTNNFGAVTLLGTTHPQLAHERVPVMRIDDLDLPRCDLIKADVEGMEKALLEGGRQTIKKFHPVLYLECHDDERRQPLIDACRSLEYRLYWHGSDTDPNMLGIPTESALTIEGLTPVPFATGCA